MSEADNPIRIFANLYESEYIAEHIIEDIDEDFSNLEYEDVKAGNYQIWEYPSGNIFKVQADRELNADDNPYSTPYNNKGTAWQPVLIEVGRDTEKVVKAFKNLNNS